MTMWSKQNHITYHESTTLCRFLLVPEDHIIPLYLKKLTALLTHTCTRETHENHHYCSRVFSVFCYAYFKLLNAFEKR